LLFGSLKQGFANLRHLFEDFESLNPISKHGEVRLRSVISGELEVVQITEMKNIYGLIFFELVYTR